MIKMLCCIAGLAAFLGIAACTSSSPTPYQQQLLDSERIAIHETDDTGRLLHCLYERRAERSARYTQSLTAWVVGLAAMSASAGPRETDTKTQANEVDYRSDEELRQQCMQALTTDPLAHP